MRNSKRGEKKGGERMEAEYEKRKKKLKNEK